MALLFPGIQGPHLYSLFGAEVRLGSLLIGLVTTLSIAALNIVGTRFTARGQQTITYVRVALIMVFLVVAAIYAKPGNLLPLIGGPDGKFSLTAFSGVLVIVPFMYAGLSNFAPATEERQAVPVERRRPQDLEVVGQAHPREQPDRRE